LIICAGRWNLPASADFGVSLDVATPFSSLRFPWSLLPEARVSVVDLGSVVIAEPHRKLEEVLLECADQIGAVIEAVEKEIAAPDFGVTVLDQHRANMRNLEKLKARLSGSPSATSL
jgi:hypothetical protein